MKVAYAFLLLFFCVHTSVAQNPTYQVILKNDSLLSTTAYEYDVYIQRTGIVPFELATAQLVFTFDTMVSTGAISFTVDSVSSGLVPLQQPTNARLSISGNELRVAANPPPGSGSGTIIPVAPGLRLGRFRLTSTLPFENRSANVKWKNSGTNPVTKFNAYVASLNTVVTDTAGHLNNLQNGSLFPVTITSSSPLPAGAKGIPYTDTLRAIQGTLPYTWSLSGGTLPTGVVLSASGVLDGTPTIAGDFAFTAIVTDSQGYSATKGFILHINGAYTLNISVGGGGSVSRNPDQAEYVQGASVVLTGTPLHGWLFSGWSGDTSTSTNPLSVIMYTSRNLTATFVQDPDYQVAYRSFRPDSLALDRDNFGKLGKYVKRKADKVFFKFTMRAPVSPLQSQLALTLKFLMATSGTITRGLSKTDTILRWSGQKTITTASVIDTGSTIQIDGIGTKGKPVRVTYDWSTLPRSTKGTVASYVLNQPKNPMPNRVNALAETYAMGGFGANGLMVGRNLTSPIDSSKFYGWLQAPKYTDVLKTLIVPKTLQMHTGGPAGFTQYITNLKPILKQQRTLPPNKFDDVLVANIITLKLNIAASGLGKIPVGFGELVLNDSASYAGIGQNFLNGKMVKELAYYGDSVVMGYYSTGSHVFAEDSVFRTLNRVILRVNSAFEGVLDTLFFQDSLVFKGTRPLADVPYLRPNPGIEPARIVPLAGTFMEAPMSYQLYQNYPNPFNPTTTISFDLPEHALVTLKIYNLLGQEVGTLVDHELMDDGTKEIQFGAADLASGVYFYRIVAEGLDEDGGATEIFHSVKRMVLVK